MVAVTDATFQTAVVERSTVVPVVVDLWAEWCGPCKQLGPIIEKVVAETNGAVELATVDVDANQGVSQAFQVQSIPAVFAIQNGEVVDSFVGAKPEAEVREFVQKLVGAPPAPPASPADELAAAGDEDSLRAALDLESDHPGAVIGLAMMLISRALERADDDPSAEAETTEAMQLLERIPETSETRRLAALARSGVPQGDVEATLESLLAKVKTDEDARQKYVDTLDLLGPDDPRTAEWRRKLSTALF